MKKLSRYLVLLVLLIFIPISCSIQKRIYRPGYFIQWGRRVDVKQLTTINGKLGSSPNSNDTGSLQIPFGAYNLYAQKEREQVNTAPKTELGPSAFVSNEVTNNNRNWNKKTEVNKGNSQSFVSEPEKTDNISALTEQKNTPNEYPLLIFLIGALSGGIIILASRRVKNTVLKLLPEGLKKPGPFSANAKNRKEISNIADRINRCADRYANANNEKIELVARKVAIAVNKSDDLSQANELEKLFNEVYLTPANDSTVQYLTLHNLLSKDKAYDCALSDSQSGGPITGISWYIYNNGKVSTGVEWNITDAVNVSGALSGTINSIIPNGYAVATTLTVIDQSKSWSTGTIHYNCK